MANRSTRLQLPFICYNSKARQLIISGQDVTFPRVISTCGQRRLIRNSTFTIYWYLLNPQLNSEIFRFKTLSH